VRTDLVLEPGDLLTLEVVVPDTVATGTILRYAVASATSSGTRARATTAALPTAFALSQNEPNPFGEGTLIRFALPRASAVAIEVFDLLGRRVRSLTKREWQAGYHSLTWDGRDASGRRVTPGVYLYRMLAAEFHESRKMVVTP
jgi:hypothetical protein